MPNETQQMIGRAHRLLVEAQASLRDAARAVHDPAIVQDLAEAFDAACILTARVKALLP